jgi:hypothetical protein
MSDWSASRFSHLHLIGGWWGLDYFDATSPINHGIIVNIVMYPSNELEFWREEATWETQALMEGWY